MNYFKRLKRIYRKHIQDAKEEPRFLILTSFLITFIIARLTVYGIMSRLLPKPFGFFYLNGIHIHHLVYGIILLLVAGFIRIPQFGKSLVRFSSVLYGIGAALTLDEFSLLIHFNPNVYFGPEGRLSLDVVFIFFLFCLAFLWHGRFWAHVTKEILSWFR